jgi:hypothetical protein
MVAPGRQTGASPSVTGTTRLPIVLHLCKRARGKLLPACLHRPRSLHFNRPRHPAHGLPIS